MLYKSWQLSLQFYLTQRLSKWIQLKFFLNLMADIDIYMEVLPDWEINEEILKDIPKQAYKFLKALYGLK